MISHTRNSWHQIFSLWHHIHSLWYHTKLCHSHTLYSCHHTQDTCRLIHCSWAITYSLLIRARLQYMWYQTTICMTSYVFYVISQPLLLTSKGCIHDITSKIFLNTDPTVYDITYTTLVTSQPLYLCHYTDGTHLCINVSLYWWNHNKCVCHHTWHTYNIIPNLHPITFTLYDINDHVLWYHIHAIHAIRSSLYDIISTL